MKNYKLYMILSLIFFIVSCEKENKIEFSELGTEFFISGDYTSLDGIVTFTIENQQKNLSQVVVTALGGLEDDEETEFEAPKPDLGTISLTAGDGSLTVTDVELGMTTIGWTADFQFDASYNGKAITRSYNLAVGDPISVEDPHVTHRNDTVYHFTFAIEPTSSSVETVVVQSKVGALGTYVDFPGPFNAVDSIPITGTDYSIGDTLFVNVIGTSGTKTAETETELVIGALSVSNTEMFELDVTPDQAFDFIAADYVVTSAAGESADIEFTGSYSANGLIIGFVSNQNAEFVPGTSADYESADSLTLINMDFTGSITFDDNVSEGNVYYFRTNRGGGDWFIGVMKIATLDKPQGILEDSYMEIEYKH